MMSDVEYKATQDKILLLAQLASSELLDLDEFLSRISHAHAVAPFVDPTLYMKAMDRLQIIEDLARALAPFRKAALEASRKLQAMEPQQS